VTPFPPIARWRIPTVACKQTREAVLPAGHRGTESGAFWLGTRAATSTVTTVVKPVGAGIVEDPWQWAVSPEHYAAISSYAKPRGLSLLAVVHTHLSTQPPRMSRTDRTQGVKVQDALAVIVGSAGEQRDPLRWGWFVYDEGDYRDILGPELAERITLVEKSCDFIEITAKASS
jgi:hypothetical protein